MCPKLDASKKQPPAPPTRTRPPRPLEPPASGAEVLGWGFQVWGPGACGPGRVSNLAGGEPPAPPPPRALPGPREAGAPSREGAVAGPAHSRPRADPAFRGRAPGQPPWPPSVHKQGVGLSEASLAIVRQRSAGQRVPPPRRPAAEGLRARFTQLGGGTKAAALSGAGECEVRPRARRRGGGRWAGAPPLPHGWRPVSSVWLRRDPSSPSRTSQSGAWKGAPEPPLRDLGVQGGEPAHPRMPTMPVLGGRSPRFCYNICDFRMF